jgi:2-amino-4-hydroxy-6-hydroxymethyldihydropteridine diphosphokinase
MTNRAIIAIGSNIDAQNNINQAIRILGLEFNIIRKAPFLTTQPIGDIPQDDFINSAISLDTHLPMDALKLRLKSVEDQLGRDRSRPKYGPREIDLDVLAWNGAIVDDDYYSRDFLQTLYLILNQ